MRIYWDLFISFFKIGLFTFGGGYAMLPLIQKIMKQRGWATEKEILNYYALSQMTPGIIAVNISTFVGYKLKGWSGAICTMIGIIAPSLIVITLLALGLSKIWTDPIVQNAFASVQLMVPALILPIIVKMVKDRATDRFCLVLMGLALFLALLNCSPVEILLLCGFVSFLRFYMRGKK
ncbi:MAG: chromate transporter [Alphaproteobacteria bacterium]|nr:chromate transporter [Alphaproteobacteria bacterium]